MVSSNCRSIPPRLCPGCLRKIDISPTDYFADPLVDRIASSLCLTWWTMSMWQKNRLDTIWSNLVPALWWGFVPPDPFKDCDGFVMAESVQRLAVHCQNLVAFLKRIDRLHIRFESTIHKVLRSPSLSLPSWLAWPVGRMVLTKMPMLPFAESRPPTIEKPRDFFPWPFSNTTWCKKVTQSHTDTDTKSHRHMTLLQHHLVHRESHLDECQGVRRKSMQVRCNKHL